MRISSRLSTATFSGVFKSCAVSALRRKFARANASSHESIARRLAMNVDHRHRFLELPFDDREFRIVRRQIRELSLRLEPLRFRHRRIDLGRKDPALGEHDHAIGKNLREAPRDYDAM